MAKRGKVKWGVLGVASIAVRKVIPGMQAGEWSEVAAIASRDLEKGRNAAKKLGIPKTYGSYEELLADPEIEAVYIPLPNHLHVPWSIKAAEAGKHVLCEKPLSLSVAEAKTLLAVRDRTGVKIGEAFMVKTHPQWLRTRELIRAGRIGDLKAIMGVFSYFNRDAANVRNVRGMGRRRDHGYRLLPDRDLAIYFWRRAGASVRADRTRSRVQDRSAGIRNPGFSVGTGDICLQHTDGPVPAHAVLWDQRAD